MSVDEDEDEDERMIGWLVGLGKGGVHAWSEMEYPRFERCGMD